MIRIAIFIACFPPLAIAQNPARDTLDPAWTWSASATIEWCHEIGDPPVALLVQAQDGRLEQLNLISGKGVFRRRPADVKGQRFIGISGDAAFLFDDAMIRSVSVTRAGPAGEPDAAELWSIDAASTAEKVPDDDPEFKRRLIAARPSPAGLLVARSDGRVAELNRTDGGLKWSAALPPSADMRLFGLEKLAFVLHRGKSGIDASLFDLSAAAPAPRTIEFADSWPMWCETCADGLIAAWPGKLVRLSADGAVTALRPRVQLPLRADALALLPRMQGPARPLLTVIDQSGELSAHDLLTSERVWAVRPEHARGAALEAGHEGTLMLGDRGEIEARHRDGGALLGRYTGSPAARPLGIGVASNFLFGLRVLRAASGDELQLVRTPLLRSGNWTRERAVATEGSWSLGRAGKPRVILWPPGRLVIVDDRRIRTFVLPT